MLENVSRHNSIPRAIFVPREIVFPPRELFRSCELSKHVHFIQLHDSFNYCTLSRGDALVLSALIEKKIRLYVIAFTPGGGGCLWKPVVLAIEFYTVSCPFFFSIVGLMNILWKNKQILIRVFPYLVSIFIPFSKWGICNSYFLHRGKEIFIVGIPE